MRDAIAESGVVACVNQFGSVATAFFNEGPVTDWDSSARSNTEQFAAYYRSMVEQGFLIAPSQYEALFVSLAHTACDIDEFIGAFKRALQVVKAM